MNFRERRIQFCYLLGISYVLWFAAIPSHAAEGEVRVAVAANFLGTLHKLAPIFEAQSNYRLIITSGSTGKLYIQILHGAPYDVFLAADIRRPELLEFRDIAEKGSRFTYASGRLVLWVPAHESDALGCLAWLHHGDFRKLAIANPKTAPYGAAAQQTLQRLSLWEKFQEHLVRGESIDQVYQFIQSRNADLGFVAASQLETGGELPGCQWPVPQEDYEPLEQQAVLLGHGRNNHAADAFLQFLRSEEAKAVIEDHGYGVP